MGNTTTFIPELPKDLKALFQQQAQHQFEVARSTARERKAKLRRLHAAMLRHREALHTALWADFRKSPEEVDISEIATVNSEIRYVLRHLASWMAPKSVGVRLPLLGSSARIHYEPKGVCLIIAPSNFPVNLALMPLIAAVAAGNCAIIKPAENTPNTARLIRQIVSECFDEQEVAVVEGDGETAQQLLELPFNHIFFTGGPAVGKQVMAAAAKNLASVTLELGGKSPVIVDETADLDRAASRIVWLKCMNGGQICIAPDYVLVHESVHDAFVERCAYWIKEYYGDSPEARQASPDLCRMIHDRAFGFAKGLLDDATQRGAQVAFGGHTDAATRYLEPTVLTDVPEDAAIWEHEIFSSLLPVRRYRQLDEAIHYIRERPKPLALYLFSNRERHIREIIGETRSGGVCINECALHFFNPELPFGGQNNSGFGRYHGKYGFLEFSHARGIARQHSPYPTTNFFLPPYGSGVMKKMLDWLVRWL